MRIKAGGYEEDETHWTGWLAVSPSEPDYDFWHWLACVRHPPELLQEGDLGNWKREYAASRMLLAGDAS